MKYIKDKGNNIFFTNKWNVYNERKCKRNCKTLFINKISIDGSSEKKLIQSLEVKILLKKAF